MQDFLKTSSFNFIMHDKEVSSITGSETFFGKYVIYFSEDTPIKKSCLDNRELILFGYAVDVRTGESNQVTELMLRNTKSMQELLEYEKFLGGKYILFYSDGDNHYVIPDATASIPFYYYTDGNACVCSSVTEYIAENMELKEDSTLHHIRKHSEISQAMPFDLTTYRNVKQLLPNHYYELATGKVVRFVNADRVQEEISPEEAAKTTIGYIQNITKYYSSMFKLYCPITSGRDSRVVLAFLRRVISEKELPCYTIKHAEHGETTQDLVVPKILSERFRLCYQQITDVLPSEELNKYVDNVLGEGKYSKRTLMIANTVYNSYGDGAIINGDIIGQVGKCSLHRDIPKRLATAGYFRCKLHNYSDEAKMALQDWLDDIKSSSEMISTFDLFSIENRMGRWAAQENIIYNLIGQKYLNIFNSRCIIYEWTRVNRALRKKSLIHISLINEVEKELLSVPFEKDENFLIKLSKATGILYYLSSYLKYYIKRMKFKRGLKNE